MSDKPVSLQLGEMILELFRDSGATQLEQLAALDVARALVPVSGSSLTGATCQPASDGRFPPDAD